MIEKFFTTEQVASILQVHPFTILKFIKSGRLKGIKLGRVYRIKESDVKEFLDKSAIHSEAHTEKEVKAEKVEPQIKIEKEVEKKGGDEEHFYII